jgi:mannose-6-phosphate isomerase-like protein (cupin superfamily)
MSHKVRRVVTGQTADGTSVFVSDEEVEPVVLSSVVGPSFHRVWGSDGMPQLPTDGTSPDQPAYFPPPGGYRFGFYTLPPSDTPIPENIDFEAAMAEMRERLPGMLDVMEPDSPGMHTTDTVDLDLVISGEVYLELDDGAEVRLGPGDCVVQNGTRHAWHNRSGEPAVLFVALIGGTRRAS